jgi:hypothetical protein
MYSSITAVLLELVTYLLTLPRIFNDKFYWARTKFYTHQSNGVITRYTEWCMSVITSPPRPSICFFTLLHDIKRDFRTDAWRHLPWITRKNNQSHSVYTLCTMMYIKFLSVLTEGHEILLPSVAWGLDLGPTQPPIQWVPGSLRWKRPGREAEHSILYSAEIENSGVIPPLPHISLCHRV